MSSVAEVIEQMRNVGMPDLPPGHPKLNGKFQRFGPKKKGWYVLREMTLKSGKVVVTGAFGWFEGENRNTIPVTTEGEQMSDEDRAELVRQQREIDERETQRRKHDADLAANRAKDQWQRATIAEAHEYLSRKSISPENVRVDADGLLLVPMRKYALEGSVTVGLQKIAPDGEKRYNSGVDKIGAACLLGRLTDADVMAIGEGYATCRSVRMACPDLPVMVAFDAGNIIHVATAVRRDFPALHIIFLADDDYQLEKRFIARLLKDFNVDQPVAIDATTHEVKSTDGLVVTITAQWREDAHGVRYIDADVRCGRRISSITFKNAGVSCSRAAAASVGNASVAVPTFSARGDNKWTDFNDLHVEQGLDAVAQQLVPFILAAQRPVVDLPASPLPSDEEAHCAPEYAVSEIPLHDAPPPPRGEGEASAVDLLGDAPAKPVVKEKPKKEYGPEHWDRVHDVLENFILIYGEDMVWDVRQRMLMKISAMRTIVQSSDVMKFWGGDARKWVLKKNIIFDPRQKKSPATSGPTATVNLFTGWQMKPKKGNCVQIQALLLHLVDGDEDMATWILRWLAYPLRNPGAKLETSIIMHGDEGSGKNFFFEKVVTKIYGEYGHVIGNAQLESQFNDWASMKLFMVADEVVTRSELKHMKGKLKYLISGEKIIINPKGLPERYEDNRMNFVFLSNELQPLALDKTDRRYLVVWTPPALGREFYVSVAKEIENGGVEAFYHFLMHELDMGDFNEHTKPIYNEAKDNLIEKSLSPPELFFRDWSRGFLPLPFITCGVQQLYEAFKVWCDRSGESRFISLKVFSPSIERYSAGVLKKKLIKFEFGKDVKQRNVFLCGDQPQNKTYAEWAEDASALFETSFQKYRRRESDVKD